MKPEKRRSKSLDDIKLKENRLSCYQNTSSPVVTLIKRHSLRELNTTEYMRMATIYGWVTVTRKQPEHTHVPVMNLFQSKTEPSPPIENDPHIFDLLSIDNDCCIHYGKSDRTVTSALVEKLIEKLTREIDNEFLMDFFLVFRQFLTPIKLCKLLILRFRWALLEDTDQRRLIRIRTFVVIRHWLTHYWTFDFLGSRTLRFMLSTFLTQLQTHPLILASPRDERIIKNLRTVFKRQRKHYSETHRKDSAISISTVPVPKWTSKMRHSIRKTWEDDSKHTRLLAYLTPSQPSSTVTTGYKSIILQYRSEIMAQQFCLIEQVMLQNVTWDELVELRWRKRSSKRQSFVIDMATLSQESDGVDQMIAYFNTICQWVASEIVRSQQSDIRIKVIEKFIRIALKCYQHRNYSTMMQILLGLQSPAVSRLEKTWQKVNHCEIELFNQLKEMAKPFRNWKNVRDCMTEAVEEIAESFAVESVLTKSQTTLDHKQGCIPFLGLYLSDLVFVAELPTFIQSSCSDNHDNIRDNQLCERLNHHLVNYNKFRITASVVKHVLAFQVLSRTYKFKIQHDLYTQLQSLSLLDNAQVREASLKCE